MMKRIVIEGVNKSFMKGFDKEESLIRRLLSFISYIEPKRRVQVINDVSFSIGKGEFVGIIGRNGAGKTTMMRIIAGIYKPDSGKVATSGNIVSIIGASGFWERLSVKDNIYIYCSLLGMSNSTIKERFDSIVRYSDAQGMTRTKFFQLSEGMKQKLVFSVALHCEPDILIADESFELGDEKFKRKSMVMLREFIRKGSTVVLASHDLAMIRRHCKRVIWLEEGKVVYDGPCERVVRRYEAWSRKANGKGSEK
jgi:ABC-2 type transport system ATP-binding protein